MNFGEFFSKIDFYLIGILIVFTFLIFSVAMNLYFLGNYQKDHDLLVNSSFSQAEKLCGLKIGAMITSVSGYADGLNFSYNSSILNTPKDSG